LSLIEPQAFGIAEKINLLALRRLHPQRLSLPVELSVLL
jgi:hypothetical protein